MDKKQKECKHEELRIINSYEIECFKCGLEWHREMLSELLITEESNRKVIEIKK